MNIFKQFLLLSAFCLTTIYVNATCATLSAYSTYISCYGSATGSIVASANGGAAPYTFNINGGAYQSSGTFNNLFSGLYTVAVKDNTGCITSQNVYVEQNNDSGILISVSDIFCAGTASGVLSINASGSGTLSYSLNGGAFQASNVFSNLVAANYTVTVKDASTCTRTVSATVSQSGTPLSISTSQTNPTGTNGTNGSITASGAGGVRPYTFSLNGGAYQSGGVFSNLAASIYIVSIKDSNGCTASKSLTLSNTQTCTPTTSTIVSNFNGNSIPAGDYIWFNSVFKANGLGNGPVTIQCINQTITIGNNAPISVPDATITISSSNTSAVTNYSGSSFTSSFPLNSSGNNFLSGLAYQVPSGGLPGGINPVTWNASFISSVANVTIDWQWGAAVYTSFSNSPAALGVKPCDDNHASTLYPNSDHAGTPENYKNYVTGGARGGGGSNCTGSYSGTGHGVPCSGSAGQVCSLGYPDNSNLPRSAVAFSENECLAASDPVYSSSASTASSIKVWYTDEHAMTLGVRSVQIKTQSGITTTTYPVTATPASPTCVSSPQVGTTISSGDQSGNDVAAGGGRPLWPALFITDVTNNPGNRSGDWQQGGVGVPPTYICGTWKAAVKVVDYTHNPAATTITPDADPSGHGNQWNLGTGSTAPPANTRNDGYGTEVIWDIASLNLMQGHTYHLQFMVHDGDQNKSGGDVGEACTTILIPNSAKTDALPAISASGSSNDFNVKLYPNPFRSNFNIEVQSDETGPIEVRIFDMLGKLVGEAKGIASADAMQVGNDLTAGIYLVEVKQGGHKTVIRAVKGN